ncbi:jg5413 [Pararge aegeria aegeria]|uniref:Jg5413 protein n=1 Tax=Pararge aegeria aegeria TaxID=348720 RepID=A0A8S4S710_9NEOP|nr:jg5413 [Pararge aegeria aegeria]
MYIFFEISRGAASLLCEEWNVISYRLIHRCTFQSEDLSPTGDEFPASVARRSPSRGQAAFMSETPAPDPPTADRLRFHIVLSQPFRRLLATLLARRRRPSPPKTCRCLP